MRQAYDYWQNQPDCYRTSHLFGGEHTHHRAPLRDSLQRATTHYSPPNRHYLRHGGRKRKLAPQPTHHHRLVCFFRIHRFFLSHFTSQLNATFSIYTHGPFHLPRTFKQLPMKRAPEQGTCLGRRSIALPTEQRNCYRDRNSEWDDYITMNCCLAASRSILAPSRVVSQSRLLSTQSEQPSARTPLFTEEMASGLSGLARLVLMSSSVSHRVTIQPFHLRNGKRRDANPSTEYFLTST